MVVGQVPRYEDVLRREAPANITSHHITWHAQRPEQSMYQVRQDSGETKQNDSSIVDVLEHILPGAVEGVDTDVLCAQRPKSEGNASLRVGSPPQAATGLGILFKAENNYDKTKTAKDHDWLARFLP